MQIPDVGAELTGGCYGFAANYMHWPEELMVGGAKHNKTGHLTRAAALQSVFQLMGERELYDFWVNTYKVHHLDWSQEKASLVLDSWQRAFSKQVKRLHNSSDSGPYNHYAFSTTSLNDALSRYSEISLTKLAIGAGLVALYAALGLMRWRDRVRSQSAIAICGVLLVCAALAAGLGFCALLGLPFNAASSHILPFLALGLGVHDIFLLAHTYSELEIREVPSSEQTALVLRRTGLAVLLGGLSDVAAFFAASIIPVPALRVFSLQAAVLLSFNVAAMLLVFPAMISLDLRRRRSGRADVLCCCLPEHPRPRPPACRHQYHQQQEERERLTGPAQERGLSISLTWIASRYYAPFVTRPSTKFIGVLLLIAVLSASAWQSFKVQDGLELADLVPQNSDEQAFLAAQATHFGFYNMYVVTSRDFEYPTNQKLLYDFHNSFMRVKNIMKNDDGGLPEFWLSLFRDWLLKLQAAFDRDYAANCIISERWYPNASDDGILAYKLLVQTGHVDNPIDKSLVGQARLVNADGIINPRAFYNYLSAWASNDALAYGACQANLRPEPRHWIYSNDHELKIPKSMPLTYAQMPFYLHNLRTTADITGLIKEVRNLCREFGTLGLSAFPTGIPFLFWEQYISLRYNLSLALLLAFVASVIVVSILLLNAWAVILVGLSLASVALQLFGIMGACGIKLSAIPAVLLVVSVGISVHFTVHVSLVSKMK